MQAVRVLVCALVQFMISTSPASIELGVGHNLHLPDVSMPEDVTSEDVWAADPREVPPHPAHSSAQLGYLQALNEDYDAFRSIP
jgi:hypothetical protein